MKRAPMIFLLVAAGLAVAATINTFVVPVSYTNLNMGTVGVQGYLQAVDNAPTGTYNDSITAVVGPDGSYAIFDVDDYGIPSVPTMPDPTGGPGTWNGGDGDGGWGDGGWDGGDWGGGDGGGGGDCDPAAPNEGCPEPDDAPPQGWVAV